MKNSPKRQQVFVMHGGDAFDSYDEYLADLRSYEIGEGDLDPKERKWKDSLGDELGPDFQVIYPHMPNKENAKYEEWKIFFEKFIPHLRDGVILVGHSLGGIFFARYLAENDFPTKIAATILVAAPHNGLGLADFVVPSSLRRLAGQGGEIILYHSTDDPVVPFSHAEKYKEALPDVELAAYTDKGHFSLVSFPEIVERIRAIAKGQ